MTVIKLHNSKTHKKEVFTPIDANDVRIYLCGPTVYDRAHIGNARNVIMFDVLYRLLRHKYGGDHVTYVRNFTDVDDKINAKAAQTGRPIRDITDETIAWYHADMDALGNLRPDHEPRATEYITQMIAMIEGLIAKGHAYAAEGHVLFDVRSYPDYGQLSGRSVDDMIAGARVEVAPYKRDPMDFVLWKPSDDDTPGWESPWGRGRPGWHIECSAMSEALLGPSFDIHGGGTDLTFPHHENEVAQSCCANPDAGFANVWLHNEMLQVEGKKMSKSLGNFFTVRDLLDQGIPGEVIRFVFLQTHYRKTMDWTTEKATQAKETLRDWTKIAGASTDGEADAEFMAMLCDDLNTAGAIDRLRELFKEDKRNEFAASLNLLGIDINEVSRADWATPYEYKGLTEGKDFQPTIGVLGWGPISEDLRDAAQRVLSRWLAFRREQKWLEADNLKEKATHVGLELRATRSSNGINGGLVKINDHFAPTVVDAIL
ncbi:cysteine--tRNA ligase [Pseudorhodobacter turbinis]|uniref:Cysteine--tRNA ligase n=1 Tax=Pseudorhodobacter turbinis TaxID=2500533 RepID=A0A4P8EDL8_9RHOB|nr:cysteine--tRNA ligase [Pseudorhodobacter turbinis]QCO54789.1 cysteine--tRNA ligase [Pseudorhodobacter turbinis]